MFFNKIIGLLLVLIGFVLLWHSLRNQDKSVWKYVSVPNEIFTGLIIILLGILIFFDLINL